MSSAIRTLLPTVRSRTVPQIATAVHRSLLHTRIPLPYDLETGLEPFLSAKALKVVSKDWQEGVLDRLNVLVDGTECEGLSALQTVKQTASDPTRSTTFNYASEALNNSFFLSTLTPKPIPLNPASALAQSITESFSSYSAFQSRFSSHVAGLHPSSGAYVWLVTDTKGNLGLVGTYAGGTVLVYQRMQMGTVPSTGGILGEIVVPKTELAVDAVTGKKASKFTTIQGGSGAGIGGPLGDILKRGGTSSGDAQARRPIHPLVCLSLHPHCYLGDYGVWGRQEYVKRWWGAIDWSKVQNSYEQIVSMSKAT